MAIAPIPVTFHVSPQDRAELVEARRRRARPYRPVAQAVALFSGLGLVFAYFAGAVVQPSKPQFASAPAARAPAPESPASPPANAPAPAALAAAPTGPDVDRTPVATIHGREDDGDPAGAPPRQRGFAPGERAPAYSGFRVTAGQ